MKSSVAFSPFLFLSFGHFTFPVLYVSIRNIDIVHAYYFLYNPYIFDRFVMLLMMSLTRSTAHFSVTAEPKRTDRV